LKIHLFYLWLVVVLPLQVLSQLNCQYVSTVDSTVFPHHYIKDDSSPRYTYVKSEGAKPSSMVFHAVKYIRKYKNKKKSTHSAEINYFKNQQEVFRWISGQKMPENSVNPVKIGFVGDIMWIRDNWNFFADKALTDKMQTYDCWMGNLESPVDKGSKVKSFFPDYYKYNSDSGLVTSFYNSNSNTSLFKVLSLANNHILDKGDKGLLATLSFLKNHQILYSGVGEKNNSKLYVAFEIHHIRFGFYAACWGINNAKKAERSALKINIIKGISPIGEAAPDLKEIKDVLKQMDNEGVDFKIISLHWGAEFEYYPHPQQVIIAREIIKNGADLIMGHHPHVVQPFEVYFVNGYEKKYSKDSSYNKLSQSTQLLCLEDDTKRQRKALVLYSLGNFTSEMYTESCLKALLFGMNVYKTPENYTDWSVYDIFYALNVRNEKGGKKHKLLLFDNEAKRN